MSNPTTPRDSYSGRGQATAAVQAPDEEELQNTRDANQSAKSPSEALVDVIALTTLHRRGSGGVRRGAA